MDVVAVPVRTESVLGSISCLNKSGTNERKSWWKNTRRAKIAQLVEQRTENPRVASSILALGINGESHDKKFYL